MSLWQRFVVVGATALVLVLQPSSVHAKSVVRRLEDGYGDSTEEFTYDLSTFSVKFQKCQYVKAFDDDVAQDEDSDTVLSTQQFIVFKLCPSDECTKCNGVHGEYVSDISDYLADTVDYEQEEFQNMCDSCNEQCDGDTDDCTGCAKLCYEWELNQANGYVDASNYIECQQLKNNNNNNGDDDTVYYIGPKCSSNGYNVSIGLFTDQYCFEPVSDIDVEDMLGYKLSYHILSNVASVSDGYKSCLSCAESQDDDGNKNENDAADGDEVNEMCEQVYNRAAKCESPYGLEDGFINVNRDEENYENQVETEFMSCTYINSLIWNSYTETGEINSYDVQDEVIREMTTNQKIAGTGMILILVGISGYAFYLYHTIEKMYPSKRVQLSAQTDGVVA